MKKKAVEVTISELENILNHYIDAGSGTNYALKIIGHPGVGKSAIVKDVSLKRNYYFIDTRLAFKENIDLGGYPVPDHNSKRMIYYRPMFIPPETVPEGYDGILWFLDESNRAHPTVIQTLFQIITEGTCGEHRLPANTAIVLAGNMGESDSTTITEFDDSALDGRLAIFHLKPDSRDWLRWAYRDGIHPSVTHYISLFPERLWDEINVNPNPRGWHQVSQAIILSYGISSHDELYRYLSDNPEGTLTKLIISLVGEIAGADFIMQIASPREITTHEILSGEQHKLNLMKQSKIPSEDILWALSGAITFLREKNIILRGVLSSEDLEELGNVLQFIGFARADSRMSFFHMMLKECGLFTQIPPALSTISDCEIRNELKKRFTVLLDD